MDAPPRNPPPDRSAELRALLDVLNEALANEGVAGTKRERIIHHVMFGVPAGAAGLHGTHSATVEWKVSPEVLTVDHPGGVPEGLRFGVPDVLAALYRRAAEVGDPHFDQPRVTAWTLRFEPDLDSPSWGRLYRLSALADVVLGRRAVGPVEMFSAVSEMLHERRKSTAAADPLPPAGEPR